ncbi:hypothetical protein LCGC14_3012720 [marine sediment metagenome]|uniref:HK97 gp10 family phage protein n=1 Tax=marine sediment metagenome TaxID=412755 RepID=A0A0F8Z5C7_9ZZZZ
MAFKPILPKNPDLFTGAVVTMTAAMLNYGLDLKREMQKYPPSATAHVRTGTLGKRWTMKGPTIKGGDLVVHVGNRTEYAPFVQGFRNDEPRQRALFKRYGWQALDVTANKMLKKHKPRIEKSLKGLG